MSKFARWRRLVVTGTALAILGLSMREADTGGTLPPMARNGVEAIGGGAPSAGGGDAEVAAGAREMPAPSAVGRFPASTRLFEFVETPEAARLTAALPAPAREVRYVRVNGTALSGKQSPFWQAPGRGRVELPLPRGGFVSVAIEGSEMTGPGEFTSTGRIEGRPASRVVFGCSGRFVHASIEDPVLGSFALRVATEDFSQFYRIAPDLVPGCGGPRRASAVQPRAAGVGAPVDAEALEGAIPAAAENPQRAVIHVMMVHTAAALPTMSGAARTQALHSAFLAAVAKVNIAFEASLISARLKLVRVHETRLPDDAAAGAKAGWQDESLTALYGKADGVMDEVHAVRDEAGADVVCLALQRADFSSSGLSFLLDQPSRFDNADYAFSVVQYGNIAGTNVVAHEMGHVFGCAHDRENALSGEGAYPYSYGYRFLGKDGRQYHDIMSYPPGTELGYFSNPNVIVPAPVNAPIGIAAGRPGEADTARTIEQTAFLTANYRLQKQAAPSPGILVNVATRAFVGRDEQVLIGGFIVSGTQPKRVLVRGVGPALRPFGVADALRDPVLRLFAGASVVAENDDWSGSEIAATSASVAAFSLAGGSADAALVATLSPGAYTAVVEGKGAETGIGLLEAYDLDPSAANRVVNLATRGYADNAGREMIGGFVVQGALGETKRILVRVLGPSLGRPPFGLTDVMEDPLLQLKSAAGELLIENDDWSSDAEGGANAENDFKPVVATHGERRIFATGHAPGNRREPCVLVDLPPGNYSVIVQPFERRSTNVLLDQPAVPGVGIVEVYEIER